MSSHEAPPPDVAMDSQGWYHDPFAVHEARWFSAGRPTALVRDGAVESSDEPPASTWDGPLELVNDDEGYVADELARADDPPEHHPVIDETGTLGLGYNVG